MLEYPLNMPASRNPGGNPREENNEDLPTGSRPTAQSQSGVTTRGRAVVESREPDNNSTRQSATGESRRDRPDNGADRDNLALLITQALGESTRRQTEALAEFSRRQTQLLNSIELGFQRMLNQTPVQTGANPVTGTPSSRNGNQPRVTPTMSTIDATDFRPDRISQIMSNWKLRFTGKGHLSVDDFIYRAEALTRQSLEGNFELLARYSSNLFEGSAAEWFWRYHKGVSDLRWPHLCEALKTQFKDARTDRDIQGAIDRRRQKPHECFDEYSQAIAAMADQLSVPLTDSYMMGVLRSNLLPEIQQELLHVHINSVAELRQAVRRHEIFKQQIARVPNFNRPVQKKIVSELTEQADSESESEVAHEEAEEVAAIEFECWNCSKKGHRYHDCRAERRVFCYGCGKPDTYRPNCTKCQASKNVGARAPNSSARTKH